MTNTFPQRVAPLRESVEAALLQYVRRDLETTPQPLQEAMEYSLLAGGKRLRAILVLLAAEACGGEISAAMPAACAIEMIHTYSLIHDDLPAMDDDELRRGKPTNHKVFGEATAILAGDGLLTYAFEILATDSASAEVAAACVACLAKAAGPVGMVGGQMKDLSQEGRPGTLEMLESIHEKKTGAMILAALQLGAIRAGATAKQHAALETYGKHLGLAFQIQDDLLDVQGEQAALGKRVNKDSEMGKLTFPGLLGIAESQRRAKDLIEQALAALAIFESRASRLEALAHYVLERDR
ncbi:Geranylgeranyl pyrophosphate synthase [Planctomycetales bacterium 10988]|nr:Geranylgeranyl pyrophosphate synthase [Planctomycetales bacterium 10988]